MTPQDASVLRTPAPRWRLTDESVPSAAILIAICALAATTPAQNDTWWHLRSGLEMWRTGSFLWTEPFSHTAFGSALNNHWWASQLAFYAAYAAGGPPLLTALAGACLVLAVYGAWALTRGSSELRVVWLLALAVLTAPEWAVRPQVISLLLLVAMLHLVARERWWWLPAVCVLWANAHALVIFGVALAGSVVIEAALWSRSSLRRDITIAGACAVSPMLSPPGWYYWPQVLSTVTASKAVAIEEYRVPLALSDGPFWLTLGALVVVAVLRRGNLAALDRRTRVGLIASAVLAVAAVSAARNVAFFAVVAVPTLSVLLADARAGAPVRDRPASRAAVVFLMMIAAGAATLSLVRWRDNGAGLGWRPIAGGVLRAVEDCGGPLYNQLEDGGYLMWSLRDRGVFVDSRMEAYPIEFLKRVQRAELQGDYEDLFRRYDIGCAVVVAGSILDRQLRADRTMQVRHTDPERVVFERVRPQQASVGAAERVEAPQDLHASRPESSPDAPVEDRAQPDEGG